VKHRATRRTEWLAAGFARDLKRAKRFRFLFLSPVARAAGAPAAV